MKRIRPRIIMGLAAAFGVFGASVSAQEPGAGMEVLISIADQKMAVLRDGGLIQKYPISTSRFGVGDAYRSYKTPLGRLTVCEKLGGELIPGAVIKHREATGEVLNVDAPGRDPIVTRILWLDGMEEQNRNAKARGIYIHGTPEEKKIGEPMSWGCIRMKSKDIMEVFNEIPVGTTVFISPEHLPKLRKYEPPKPVIIVVHTPPPNPAAKPALIAGHTPPPGVTGKTALAAAHTSGTAVTAAPAKPVPAPPTPAPSLSRIASNRTLPISVPSSQTTTSPILQSPIVSTKWSANPISDLAAAGLTAPGMVAPSAKTTAPSLPEIAQGPSPRARKKSSADVPPGGETGAFDAFKGSVLFAGLPDARAPQAAPAAEPKNRLPVVQTSLRSAPEELTLAPDLAPASSAVAAPASVEDASHLAARNPPPTAGMFKAVDHP